MRARESLPLTWNPRLGLLQRRKQQAFTIFGDLRTQDAKAFPALDLGPIARLQLAT